MNRKEAFKIASNSVSIYGRCTSYMVVAPLYANKPHGPTGSHVCSSYPNAVRYASADKAVVAIALMGGAVDAQHEVAMLVLDGRMQWNAAVREVLNHQRKGVNHERVS